MKKIVGKMLFALWAVCIIGCVNVNSNNGNTINDTSSDVDSSEELYKDFANYPDGKQNSTGTLTLKNQVNSKVLVFTDSVSPANYIGTIQSFIDRFVTMPYIRQKYGRSVQPVDDEIYAEHLLHVIYSGQYPQLRYIVETQYPANSAVFNNKTV